VARFAPPCDLRQVSSTIFTTQLYYTTLLTALSRPWFSENPFLACLPCTSFRFRVFCREFPAFAAVCSCYRALTLIVYSLPFSLPSWTLIGGTESCVRCLELTKDPDLSVVKHACGAGAFREQGTLQHISNTLATH